MKKLIFSFFSLSMLSACSGGVNEDSLISVSPEYKIRHLCLKGSTRGAPDYFVETLTASLKKKNITAERIRDNRIPCDYILAFSVKGNRSVVVGSKLRVLKGEDHSTLGLVAYKMRGDEKKRVEQVGLQGQTDEMINQLFKNY